MSATGVKIVTAASATLKDVRGVFTWSAAISGRYEDTRSESGYVNTYSSCAIGGQTFYTSASLAGQSVGGDQHCQTTTDRSTATTCAAQTTTWYLVTVAAGTGGTVSGGGWGKTGTPVSVAASPSANYGFVQWSDGNTTASRSYQPGSDITLTASFTRTLWKLTLVAGTGGTAYWLNNGTKYTTVYVHVGTSVQITAQANTGYNFSSWNDGSTAAVRAYTPTSDVTLTASFTALGQITVEAVSGNSANILGNARVFNGTSWVTTAYFSAGASVRVNGLAFDAQTTACSGWNCPTDSAYNSTLVDYSFTMPNKSLLLRAYFYERKYRATLATTGPTYGVARIRVTHDGVMSHFVDTWVWHADTALLVAVPTNTTTVKGAFTGWYKGGVLVSTALEYPLVYAGYKQQDYEARFIEAVEHSVTAAVDGTDIAGNTAVDSGCAMTITTPANAGGNWYFGHEITIQQSPAAGWELAALNGTIGGVALSTIQKGTPPSAAVLAAWGLPSTWAWGDAITFTLKGDTAITGTFGKIKYAIGYSLDADSPAGSAITSSYGMDATEAASGANPYDGETLLEYEFYVELNAIPTGTDAFRGWFQDDVLVSTDATMIVQVLGTADYVAKFGNAVAVSSADANGTATVEGAASYAFTYGEEVTILATPITGYFFGYWTEGATTKTGWGAIHSFTPTGAITLVASFRAAVHPVYLKLTNGLDVAYGELTLTVPDGVTATKITEAEWEAGLAAAFAPAVKDPSVTLGDGDLPGADSFWLLSDTCSITVTCQLLKQDAIFTKWSATYFYQYSDPDLYYNYDTANAQDVGTEPTATFAVTDHCRVMALYTMPGPKRITLGYATGSDATMGGIEIEPIGTDYHAGVTFYCDLLDGSDFTAVAKPANGYKFDGWYSSTTPTSGALVSVAAQYTQTIKAGSVNTLYAKFSQDTEAVYEWEGESVTKMAVWRSKRYVSTRPMNMNAARVYADGYPVSMSVYSASSPDHPVLEGSAASIDVLDQDARRLPIRRPEKYVEIEVRSMETVAEVAVSTAMEGLVQ